MNDRDELSPLLKTWRHTPPDAPGFNRTVWTRIAAAESAPAPLLARLFRFPAAAARRAMPLAAALTLLLSLAAGSGVALAYETLTRNDRMAAEYARSIDPLQMTNHATHP